MSFCIWSLWSLFLFSKHCTFAQWELFRKIKTLACSRQLKLQAINKQKQNNFTKGFHVSSFKCRLIPVKCLISSFPQSRNMVKPLLCRLHRQSHMYWFAFLWGVIIGWFISLLMYCTIESNRQHFHCTVSSHVPYDMHTAIGA